MKSLKIVGWCLIGALYAVLWTVTVFAAAGAPMWAMWLKYTLDHK